MLYVGYGSYADTDPYHGWVFGYNATNLVQLTNYVFNTTPNAITAAFGGHAGEGGIWMGGNGFCVDAKTNLYFDDRQRLVQPEHQRRRLLRQLRKAFHH